jgi:hypothetical protein
MPYGPEEIRLEYQTVVTYHTSLVNSRFTIAGLYVAAIGFLAGTVMKGDVTWPARAAGSVLGIWLTGCLWVLELRSRALFENLAHRGIEIEHRYWGLMGDDWMSGFFSRQYKEPPNHSLNGTSELPRRANPDRPVLGWSKRPLSAKCSRHISHRLGLDLLYIGGLTFWLCSFVVSIWAIAFCW